MVFLIIWITGIIIGIVTTLLNSKLRSIRDICSNLLFYQLVVTCFLMNLIGFIGHVFYSDMVAESVGWAAGSPFQKEIGFAELGFAVISFMCIWFYQKFRLAVIVSVSTTYICCALNHIIEIISKGNYSPSNTLSIVWDLLIPLTWIVLYIMEYKFTEQQKTGNQQ
ncbi:MAG: DUF6790 family protein [Treponema sp.]